MHYLLLQMFLNIWIIDGQVVCFILVSSAEFHSCCHECDGPGRVLRKGRQIFNTQIFYEIAKCARILSAYVTVCFPLMEAGGRWDVGEGMQLCM